MFRSSCPRFFVGAHRGHRNRQGRAATHPQADPDKSRPFLRISPACARGRRPRGMQGASRSATRPGAHPSAGMSEAPPPASQVARSRPSPPAKNRRNPPLTVDPDAPDAFFPTARQHTPPAGPWRLSLSPCLFKGKGPPASSGPSASRLSLGLAALQQGRPPSSGVASRAPGRAELGQRRGPS